MTPTQRSLKLLRSRGYTAEVTERWNSFSKTRRDLLGFGDILAVNCSEVLLVQATTGSNFQARLKKILDSPEAAIWVLGLGRKILVHAWSKRGPRGARKIWQCRELILPLEGGAENAIPAGQTGTTKEP